LLLLCHENDEYFYNSLNPNCIVKTAVSIVLFLVCNFFATAQEYEAVDKIAATYPTSFPSIKAFAQRLEKDFTKDAERVRAAYYWLAHNIQYNFKVMGTSKTGYPKITIKKYKDEADFHYKFKKIYAEYALEYKVAVCEGYSQILFYLCEYLGIKSALISGNSLRSIHQYDRIPEQTNHKWNAVFFNNTWNLIDVTWATGNRPDKPNHVDFQDFYFCTPPERMILNHFPKDPKWQLLETPMSKEEFYSQPIAHSPYLALDNVLDQNIRRQVAAKDEYVSLRFKRLDTTQKYFYTYSRQSRSRRVQIVKVGDEYILKVPFFYHTTKDKLTIYVGRMGMLSFEVIPEN